MVISCCLRYLCPVTRTDYRQMNRRMELIQASAAADHGDLSDYYSYDELENDNKLRDQEEDC